MSDFARIMLDAMAEKPSYSTKNIHEIACKMKDKIPLDTITECVLKEMFCENTGTHPLDSGGAFGRGWQRSNALKDLDWMQAKRLIHEVEDGYLKIQKNAYLFLCDHLSYDIEMDKRFHEFCELPENQKEGYYYLMKDFITWKNDFEYLWGANTYNGDSILNRVLQFEVFECNNFDYIIIQIHNGADVRGGYSTPHVFVFNEEEFVCDLDNVHANCPDGHKKVKTVQRDLNGNIVISRSFHCSAYTDDGNHWYADNGSLFEVLDDKVVCPLCKKEIEFE